MNGYFQHYIYIFEAIKKEPFKLKSRSRTGGADIDGKGVPNGADTHKKGVTESRRTGRKKTEVKTRRAMTSGRCRKVYKLKDVDRVKRE